MSLSVDFNGEEAAQKAVEELADRLEAGDHVEAAKKGAEVIREEAAARVPMSAGAPSRGGKHLKDAIAKVVRKDGEDRVVVAVGPESDQFHGIFVELGTEHMPADPYLRPAVDDKGPQAIKVVADELEADVEEATIQIHNRRGL